MPSRFGSKLDSEYSFKLMNHALSISSALWIVPRNFRVDEGVGMDCLENTVGFSIQKIKNLTENQFNWSWRCYKCIFLQLVREKKNKRCLFVCT